MSRTRLSIISTYGSANDTNLSFCQIRVNLFLHLHQKRASVNPDLPIYKLSNRMKLIPYTIATVLVISIISQYEITAQESKTKKPNIILIMADDIGYEAFGSYGNTNYKTPRLDKMASEGMQFNYCYSQPLCTPSRVKIMTGKEKYQKRRFVQNTDWKLYESGEFYNVKNDPYEKKYIPENKLSAEVKLIRQQFQGVLGQMHVKEAR